MFLTETFTVGKQEPDPTRKLGSESQDGLTTANCNDEQRAYLTVDAAVSCDQVDVAQLAAPLHQPLQVGGLHQVPRVVHPELPVLQAAQDEAVVVDHEARAVA